MKTTKQSKALASALLAAFLVPVLGGASTAAPASAPVGACGRSRCGGGPAMRQLLAAAPSGTDALARLQVPSPKPVAAPAFGQAGAESLDAAFETDLFISGAAQAAARKGNAKVARLLWRLSKEGTAEEKLEFVNGSGPYRFPARFEAGAPVAAGVCVWVTETVCALACWGTGVERECRENCRDILVKSCDN